MSFNEINPETGRSWTRAELFAALEQALDDKGQLMIAVDHYDGELANQTERAAIITWPEQAANLRARWAIHLDEYSTAVKELQALGKSVRVFIEDQREYWTSNPLLKQPE